MTLTGFLLARIAEDEAAALAVPDLRDLSPYGGQETISHTLNTYAGEDGYPRQAFPPEIPAHYARHNPARVLAECEAKRATITEVWAWIAGDDWREGCCHKADVISQGGVCRTFGPDLLRPMAAVYADHPDYQQEWAL